MRVFHSGLRKLKLSIYIQDKQQQRFAITTQMHNKGNTIVKNLEIPNDNFNASQGVYVDS